MNRFVNKCIHASTLPELMVVTIIGGMIFCLLFDGVDLVRRFSGHLVNGMVEQMSVYEDFNKLNVLVLNCDSLCRHASGIGLFHAGNSFAEIGLVDSLFVLRALQQSDTLGIKIDRFQVFRDSMMIVVSGGQFVFKVASPMEEKAEQEIYNEEEKLKLW